MNPKYTLSLMLALVGCDGITVEHDVGLPDAGSDTMPRILSVYYGLDELPLAASLLCGAVVAGQDGVPVTFSVQLDGATVAPEDFVVETATGARVTPDCATLAPATEPLELRTVLDASIPEFWKNRGRWG